MSTTSNVPELRLMISTEHTLHDAVFVARVKAAAFFGVAPEAISLHLKHAERDVDLESVETYEHPEQYVETVESYHCSFVAMVRA